MTLNELTQKAVDFIVETQKDNDYICEQMMPEWCETHCIDHLRQGCVIEFLTNMYEKGKGNMKHVVKAISLTCDGCGQQFETLDGMVCYADDEDGKLIEETARNSDWKIMNGHHYCENCWERDDDDIIHTKDGRKWDDSDIETVEVTEE